MGLRKLNKKIKPIFKVDPESEGGEVASEIKDGEIGKGPLVRKYIKNLDMDFYASRAAETGGDSMPQAFRASVDLVKDISIMLATGKTRFRDKSEFIRTAIYILMNYYADIVGGKFSEIVGLRKMEDLIEYERSESIRVNKVIETFKTQFEIISKEYGDEVLHKYIDKIIENVKGEKRPHIKKKLMKAFSEHMEYNRIDPKEYFPDYKKN
jgi:hypothetical protein